MKNSRPAGVEHSGPSALSARALAAKIANGELSARAVLHSQLALIERREDLGAVVSIDVESAQKQAEAADRAIANGTAKGRLHGVPITLKDGIDVAGLRTTIGTAVFDRIATENATVAARLQAEGAIVIGHTNVAPFLADYQTENQIFGRTVNPWSPAHTAGGSSGGAAAAVAAGLSPLEVASDLGGSVRLPAHFCGIYGLKPTENRVPMTGFFRLPPGAPRTVRILSCLGPLARDLDDLALALAIIAGPDGEDMQVPPVALLPSAPLSLRGMRLAFARALPGSIVARALGDEVTRVAEAARRAGAHVEERAPDCDFDRANKLFGDLVSALTAQKFNTSLDEYFAALHVRDAFIVSWEKFFRDWDALIVPPAMTAAFPCCAPGSPLSVDGKDAPYFAQGAALAMANFAGLPALVAPSGRDGAGLPVGIQIVGPQWSESTLIEICRTLESVGILPGFQAPPAT